MRRLPVLVPVAGILALVLAAAPAAAVTPLAPEDLLAYRYLDAPALSPDGRWVAFTVWEAQVGEEKSTLGPQIWLIRPDGGEARRLTAVEGGVGPFQWSPDGSELAFLATEPVSEERQAAEKALDDARVVDTEFRFRHLWRIAADLDGEPQPQRVTGGAFQVASFDYAPDGSSFVLAHQPTPRLFEWRDTEISTVPAGGGELVPLVRNPGMDMAPLFSPDGSQVAFVSDRGNRSWARDWRLCLVPAGGGEVTVLPRTFDSMPGEVIDADIVAWAADGSGLYYTEIHRADIDFFFAPADGGPYRQVTDQPGAKGGFAVSRDGDRVAYIATDFGQPEEIYVRALTPGASPQRVSAVNQELPERAASRSRVVEWASFDGLEIEGLLHLPAAELGGEAPYPLLVELHGGPTWAFSRASTRSLFDAADVFTGAGFAVLQVNPRGSDGYGKELRFANLGDWGGKDVRDVLAGVDTLVAEGVADRERLGVFGWSYGGFLTGMVISRSQRFGAAVVGAGPVHMASMAGTTDITGFIPNFFGSEPWEEPELWRDRSAVYHAPEITTPTLILHGENDLRVPLGQAYELYHAIDRAGGEAQLVIFPRSGHGVGEPKLAVDVARRQLEWFEEHLLAGEGGGE